MVRYAGPRGGNSGGNRGGNSGGNRGNFGGNSSELLPFSREHADSSASPLLSETLVAVRDAITGHWKGDRTVNADAEELLSALQNGNSYLDKVKLPYQGLILDCMLKSAISVEGSLGVASLKVGHNRITKIQRPDPDYFEKSLHWVRAYADLRDDRVGEIHVQLDDMLSFFGALAHLDLGRRKYTLLLLDIARSLAIYVETPMKFFCPAVRPNEYAMEVQPMIQTPDHSTYPSGHAMEAFAIATVLHRLSSGKGSVDGTKKQALPFRLAHRIAVNRTVAGVHFPVDSLAGAWVGCFIGDLIYAFATGTEICVGDLPKVKLKKNEKGDTLQPIDFLLSNFPSLPDGKTNKKQKIEILPVAKTLWNRAAEEWPHTLAKVVDSSDV